MQPEKKKKKKNLLKNPLFYAEHSLVLLKFQLNQKHVRNIKGSFFRRRKERVLSFPVLVLNDAVVYPTNFKKSSKTTVFVANKNEANHLVGYHV